MNPVVYHGIACTLGEARAEIRHGTTPRRCPRIKVGVDTGNPDRRKRSIVIIIFRTPPVRLFARIGCVHADAGIGPDSNRHSQQKPQHYHLCYSIHITPAVTPGPGQAGRKKRRTSANAEWRARPESNRQPSAVLRMCLPKDTSCPWCRHRAAERSHALSQER